MNRNERASSRAAAGTLATRHVTVNGGHRAVHGPVGSRARVTHGMVFMAILVAVDAPEPDGSSIAASNRDEAVHRWPGARSNPDGLYSWTGGTRWMHNVTQTGTPVEVIFSEVDEMWGVPVDDIAASSATLDRPYVGRPVHVADTRLQAWLLDLDGMRVAILVKSFTDSDPALVAEAEAIVESIRVESTESGHRLVFRLLEGWDSG